jgi:hypothetical protein
MASRRNGGDGGGGRLDDDGCAPEAVSRRGAPGFLTSGVARPSSGEDFSRRALSWLGTSLVISATRAPAFGGQKTGGPGGLAGSRTSAGNRRDQRDDPRFRRVRPRADAVRSAPVSEAGSLPDAVAPHYSRRELAPERSRFPGLSTKRTTGLEPATFGLGSRRSEVKKPCSPSFRR